MNPVADRTWVEVDLDAIRGNCKRLKQVIGESTRLMAVVKANGYGHGAAQVARACLESGATSLGVATAREALRLREAGFKEDILVFVSSQTRARDLAVAGVTQTVHSLESLESLERQCTGIKARAHLKIETGMNRIGVRPGPELDAVLARLGTCRSVEVEGVYTHFAEAEAPDFAGQQLSRFHDGVRQMERAGLTGLFRHTGGSTPAILMPGARLDAVRVGIALYGYHPCDATKGVVDLTPAATWKATVAQVKPLEKGDPVGYGRTYTAAERRLVATVRVGYADGYSRALSGRGQVLVGGRLVPVIGRVCMDCVMIDVTGAEAADCREVTLMGPGIPADCVGSMYGTISYEVLTSISDRVLRVYSGC